MEIGDSRGSDELQRQEVVVTATAVDVLKSRRRFRCGHYVCSVIDASAAIICSQQMLRLLEENH